jgi:hypothetical protein
MWGEGEGEGARSQSDNTGRNYITKGKRHEWGPKAPGKWVENVKIRNQGDDLEVQF